MADADAATATKIASGLRSGTLIDDLGPLPIRTVIGAGQSMGGHLLTLAQARHRPFDAVAILGSSAIHTVLPFPPDVSKTDFVAAARHAFHWDDVDPEILELDLGGFPVRKHQPMWASPTTPPGAPGLLQPGVQSAEAARITSPVFIGVGERDVTPDPWIEPTAYRASSDISLQIVGRMAHMHNFAPTRIRLWERVHAWGGTLE